MAATVVAGIGLGVTAMTGASAESQGQADLAQVRAATARYHDVGKAEADGFVDLGLCFDQMGEHWGRPSDIDGVVTARAPEALVYAHVGDRLRLVAVEYVATGPGSVLGMPLHHNPAVDLWVLHAWVWMHNPDDMHADLNPRVGDCPV
jgi:hypothetical protein